MPQAKNDSISRLSWQNNNNAGNTEGSQQSIYNHPVNFPRQTTQCLCLEIIWSKLLSHPVRLLTCRMNFSLLLSCRIRKSMLIEIFRFPPPRIFTNSLLNSPDITALIRDTEAHERALFQIDPAAKPSNPSQRRATRRGTTFQPEPEKVSMASQIYAAKNNRHQSAVARVLGSDMMEEIKRSAGTSSRGAREVNIEVLLRGAEILCNV